MLQLSTYITDNRIYSYNIYLKGKTKSVSFTHKRLNQNRRNLEITKTNLLTNKNKNNEKTEFLDAGSRSVAGIVQPGRRTAKHSTQQRGSKPMTITASLPTDGMQTRAAGDEAATRCYVQILDKDGNPLADGNSEPMKMDPYGGSFSTLVYLNGNETYDFLFWADTEATDAAAPADLKAVAYTNGKTIAWAGKIDNNP